LIQPDEHVDVVGDKRQLAAVDLLAAGFDLGLSLFGIEHVRRIVGQSAVDGAYSRDICSA